MGQPGSAAVMSCGLWVVDSYSSSFFGLSVNVSPDKLGVGNIWGSGQVESGARGTLHKAPICVAAFLGPLDQQTIRGESPLCGENWCHPSPTI